MAIEKTPQQELSSHTRRSFIALGVGAVAAAGAWELLNRAPIEDGDLIPAPLRRVLGFNERVVRKALYSESHLVRTYPASAVGKIKVNGEIGMENPIDPKDWHLDLAPAGA